MHGSALRSRSAQVIAIALIVLILQAAALAVAGRTDTERDTHVVPILNGAAQRPPNGDLLIPVPQDAGSVRLFVVPVDGSGAYPLLPDVVVSGLQSEGVWSPDGSQVAFTVHDGRSRELYVVNADGTGLRQLAPVELTEPLPRDWVIQQQSPAWSPDGTTIAFSSNRAVDRGGQDLYLVNVDGSDLRRLTDDGLWEFAPRWSPDGSRIAYEALGAGRGDYGSIYIVNADGSNRRQLVTMTGARDPNWSPDGEWIAFAAGRIGSTLHIVHPDGSDTRNLSVESMTARWPRWSPDGTMLAWTAHDTGGSLEGVFVFDPVADTTRHISVLSGVIEWSPGGQWIVVAVPEITSSGQATGIGGLYLIRQDGRAQRSLLDIAIDEYDVTLDWRPAP